MSTTFVVVSKARNSRRQESSSKYVKVMNRKQMYRFEQRLLSVEWMLLKWTGVDNLGLTTD